MTTEIEATSILVDLYSDPCQQRLLLCMHPLHGLLLVVEAPQACLVWAASTLVAAATVELVMEEAMDLGQVAPTLVHQGSHRRCLQGLQAASLLCWVLLSRWVII